MGGSIGGGAPIKKLAKTKIKKILCARGREGGGGGGGYRGGPYKKMGVKKN